MSITIDISDEKLREAEELLNIHDPTELFRSLLDDKLAQHALRRALDAAGVPALDADLPPASLTQEEAFRYLSTIGGSMPEMEPPRRRRVEDYE